MMFTVIEITKNSRNLVTKHLMVINSFLDEEAIDDLVMDWCTNDPSGQANGWSFTWELVTEKHKIILAVDTELRSLEKIIESMTSRVYQLKYKKAEMQIVNANNDFKLGQKVYHKRVYDGREQLTIIGIRTNFLELEGDYSGGTHNVCQSEWLPVDGVLLTKNIK